MITYEQTALPRVDFTLTNIIQIAIKEDSSGRKMAFRFMAMGEYWKRLPVKAALAYINRGLAIQVQYDPF